MAFKLRSSFLAIVDVLISYFFISDHISSLMGVVLLDGVVKCSDNHLLIKKIDS